MVGYLKSFHKDSDCHGGQTSYCQMCNSLQPRRAFLMVGRCLLTAKGIIIMLELRERMILNHKKTLIFFISYEDV